MSLHTSRCWACGGSRIEHVGRTPPAPSRPPCRVCERPRADHGGEDDGIREDGVQICDGYEPSRLPTPEEMAATLYPPVTFTDAASVERQDHRRRCAVRTIVERDAAILARLDAIIDRLDAALRDGDDYDAPAAIDALRAELRGAS